jgi:hypothetical protein
VSDTPKSVAKNQGQDVARCGVLDHVRREDAPMTPPITALAVAVMAASRTQ